MTRKRTALDGAEAKGWDAFHAGKTRADNPYEDKRNGQFKSKTTWSRAFRTAWRCGWEKASDGRARP
jgi:ribosome modulation factor